MLIVDDQDFLSLKNNPISMSTVDRVKSSTIGKGNSDDDGFFSASANMSSAETIKSYV